MPRDPKKPRLLTRLESDSFSIQRTQAKGVEDLDIGARWEQLRAQYFAMHGRVDEAVDCAERSDFYEDKIKRSKKDD